LSQRLNFDKLLNITTLGNYAKLTIVIVPGNNMVFPHIISALLFYILVVALGAKFSIEAKCVN
jgi:hypothetical protein